MPALDLSLLRQATNTTTQAFVNASTSTTAQASDALQVVCAWPVSGQYGPGSRVLSVASLLRMPQEPPLTHRSGLRRYYVLVAACIFARKEQWLRGACLAAALLFPAVAAIHGIVLAAVHVKGVLRDRQNVATRANR